MAKDVPSKECQVLGDGEVGNRGERPRGKMGWTEGWTQKEASSETCC